MSNTNIMIRRMCYAALLSALSIVLTRFASFNFGFGFIRLGFGSIPIIISSLMCGPIYGGLTGFVADLIGAIAFPSGPYYFGYTIDSMLFGILPYFVMKLFKGRYKAQFIYQCVLVLGILAYNITFVTMFDSYTNKSLNLNFELTLWLKILIPLLVVLYFAMLFTIFHFISHKKDRYNKIKRSEKNFSLHDIYLICLTNEFIISMSLLGIWNNNFFGLPFFVNSFSQLIIFSINGILRTFLIFFIMYPLAKLDKSMPSFSLVKDEQSNNVVNNF